MYVVTYETFNILFFCNMRCFIMLIVSSYRSLCFIFTEVEMAKEEECFRSVILIGTVSANYFWLLFQMNFPC